MDECKIFCLNVEQSHVRTTSEVNIHINQYNIFGYLENREIFSLKIKAILNIIISEQKSAPVKQLLLDTKYDKFLLIIKISILYRKRKQFARCKFHKNSHLNMASIYSLLK